MRTILVKYLRHMVWLLSGIFIILVLFDSYLSPPVWLLPVGRMHPMLLHFPIVLVVAAGLISFVHIKPDWKEPLNTFLLVTAFFTILTAIMGFLLASESGPSSLLTNHKWSAIALVVLVLCLMLSVANAQIFRVFGGLSLLCVVLTGHFGANITHGKNFVLAPVMPKDQGDGSIYGTHVTPILEARCTSCHNPEKRKGQLDMTRYNELMKGGESGVVIDLEFPDSSLLLKQIYLPVAHDDHMPPEGKPQLTENEKIILSEWIKAQASPTIRLEELDSEAALVVAIGNIQVKKREPDVEFASAAMIEALNNSFRTVIQPDPEWPGLEVSYFVRAAFDPASLKDLLKVKDQVEKLDLSFMSISDEDLDVLANFRNMKELTLNFTDIEGDGLASLAKCENLEKLAVAGTPVSNEHLLQFEQPLEVYAWNTQIQETEEGQLRFHFGYHVDQEDPIKLTPPELGNSKSTIKEDELVKLVHNVPGVEIFYRVANTDQYKKYKEPVAFEEFATIHAFAYKEGWLDSDTLVRTLFKESIHIDSIQLMTEPNPKYRGEGALSLINAEKGEISDFGGMEWLGFREHPLQVRLQANKPAQRVVLSFGVNIGSYIMPPQKIELWTSEDGATYHLQQSKNPLQPKDQKRAQSLIEDFELDEPAEFLQVIVIPVPSLPSWHPGKGDKGWVFVDELYLY